MARFIEVISKSSIPPYNEYPIYINVENIISLYYLEDDGYTYVFTVDSTSAPFKIKGNVVSQIVSSANQPVSYDRFSSKRDIEKIRNTLATIYTRVDHVSKSVDALRRNQH